MNYKEIIGLSVAEARMFASNIRIVKENGVKLTYSKEYRPDRLNVGVKNGKISEILGVG